MYAIRLHDFGPAENLRHERVADPEPGPGQVLVTVAAAGVHLLDTAIRSGVRGPLPQLPELPTIPGREIAGTVTGLGAGTDPSWLGKQVVAHLGFAPGGYAELAVTEADRLHEIPSGLDPAGAVALIGTGRTAMGIVQFAEPGPDDVVLVPAAAGGLGTLLVQYAKNAGARVVGLAGGPRKTALVAANGADIAVDYTRPEWPRELRAELGTSGVTLLYDGVGGDAARAAVDLLVPGGRHLVFGWSAEGIGAEDAGLALDEEYLSARGITSEQVLGPKMLSLTGTDNPIRTLELRALDHGAAGRLRPAVQRYPLAEAARAHHDLEHRATVGKVVLEPGPRPESTPEPDTDPSRS
ncbi:zinc-binding dehydrogenase [Streptomyces sp. NA04227]|uniref:zinc-binding dehydrogenase n=1 Tax=Streptomyces sp. NA04227 TaxID=2742136 RepID=UPI0015902EF4|nr:zinc-binding dehydrogenase [Streptomyces sp. NA04227]QKW08270.1 zinc-binding dehydrogenase [Streptomyces sp. NA04227]